MVVDNEGRIKITIAYAYTRGVEDKIKGRKERVGDANIEISGRPVAREQRCQRSSESANLRASKLEETLGFRALFLAREQGVENSRETPTDLNKIRWRNSILATIISQRGANVNGTVLTTRRDV